ncbi:MAG: hypothetical protein ABWY19_13125 [Marmoricola sp.]
MKLATAGYSDLSDRGGSILRGYDIEQGRAPKECRFPANRMAGLLHAARDLNEHPDDVRRRALLLGMWESWARSEGATHLVRALERDMRACNAFRDRVHASYRVHSEPTPDGQDVAIDIVIDNDLDYALHVVMSGNLIAEGLLPKAPGRAHRTRSIVWGGLEGDERVVGPRSVRTFRQNVDGYTQHLSLADAGGLSRIRPHVSAGGAFEGGGCTLPVRAD